MSRFPYLFFEEFVVRTPLLSCTDFLKYTGKDDIPEAVLKEIYSNPVFQEAIYLASPFLYGELVKWLNAEKTLTPKEDQKLKNTLLKYFSRMSTRCTPFGLFSGVGLGKFTGSADHLNNNNNTQNLSTGNLLRDTKLDMHFLVSLAQHFVKTKEIRNQLLFYPNNSIYKIGNKIRYIEYQYTHGKRDYIISSVSLSEELKQILEFSQSGKTIHEIAKILVNEEITSEEAAEFIEELIDNQLLVSQLEPNVSETDFLEVLISVLTKINASNTADILKTIKGKLDKLDLHFGNPVTVYSEMEDLIRSFNTEYDQKYLFQTDLYFKNEFYLSPHWKKELKKGICFLNKIILPQTETPFQKFKKAFSERFEAEEMPLMYVLDVETGIGYKQGTSVKGLHPYLEDLRFPASQKKQNRSIHLNPLVTVLNEKLQDALLYHHGKIELHDEDFDTFEGNWDDLPDTQSFLTEIISEGHQEKLFINSSTTSSAANLLGRFHSEKSEIRNLTKAIACKENELNPTYIAAEIIHLPESRIGNIIRRPSLREYEIPYLAQSILPVENQIPVDDLYISLKNDKIVLRSKRLNKEVKPYLTNAHNYSSDTLPVYHFLADLYSQNIRTGLYFDWGGLEHIYRFLPRVEYRNIILSKARWKITDKDVLHFSPLISDKKHFLVELKKMRTHMKIPAWVQWAQFDNMLTLNLENYDMAQMFIQIIKSEKSLTIEEFLYHENNDHKQEFIFSLYKAEA
ncbi:lantibiotic biosynthesis dehydratase-like protein [Chryseobacterium sp. 52]|uniref:lantibiotic dehydratase family protein n=1 Tax=Chryseobacterium sp. 52 TaxID=2035213 RepID=UPI000C177FFA|nr:lantibiotic dehydratase family protein [Chryseobacterium sp. 52]PIF43659.1 lantibiotic biosynthesis dehydratase-like protein [Chryseobacterium sp. 52]